LTGLTLDDYFAQIETLRADPNRHDKLALLDQLQAWGDELASGIANLA
jgi:exodeoxyribonuclease-1